MEAAAWSRELAAHPLPARAALLHLWLGEWQLAANEQPETALRHFHEARARLAHADRLYGLASYDTAVAFFKEGAYADSEDAFSRLLAPKTALPGYNRKKCALWLRHAAVCAGYHAERSAQDIPEPPRLDPLCGAAALAAGLRTLGRPSDKKTLLAACRVTGEGSSLNDIRDAGQKLGVSVDALTADDQGLMALPMPLVAHVEHDHFVALIRADKRGVSYLCSDCGPWPGGRVDLTWKQWHLLEPDVYCAVSIKNSPWNQTITALPTTRGTVSGGVQVASAGRLPRLGRSLEVALHLSHLGPHVLRYDWGGYLPECTVRWDALKCADCLVCCLEDAIGGGNRYGDGSLGGMFGGGADAPHSSGGASGGDPVNLATGEEEYRPAPDLTVYNPVGPSVQWTRLYDSLRGINTLTYETEDYGPGWSQGYNVGVRNSNAVASSPYSHCLTGITSPVLANGGGSTGYPYPTSDSWSIGGNGTTIASNTSPNGWSLVSTTDAQGTHYSITVPAGQTPGTGYSFNYVHTTGSVEGGSFAVQASAPKVGATSLYLANGGTVTINAPSVPTAGTPRVVCTPQAGAPFLVEWDYDSGSAWGHFVITWKDRTRWVTTGADGQSQYVLHQIVDRNGNAVTLNYSAPLTSTIYNGRGYITYNYDNFPLLSSISNSAGTTLLSINRNSGGGVTSVSDCYGRSVAYTSAAEGPAYVSTASLTHVSQIVPTASLSSSSLPDKYAYGYQFYTDDQNFSEPVLHTITVPSPSGPAPSTASLTVNETGTSTASINYTNGGAGFVSSLVDGNGNTRTYTNCDASGNTTSTQGNYTKVTVTDKNNNVVYSYIGGVDMYMSGKSVTDGSGHALMSKTFSDSHDPYRPSSVTDGNGNTAQMTWDAYANVTSMTPPSSGVRTPAATTYTYSYVNFALGELTQVQTGSKSPNTYAYFEPSGLVQTVTAPLPGTVGSASTAVTSYTYDSLGNVLTVVAPGNNAASTITTTMNYTSDGSYSQPDAIGQPLTVTDNLGKITHLRYDAQGNTLGVKDALGNETDQTYDIRNLPLQTTLPATGQSGSGHAGSLMSYLFSEPSSFATSQWPAASLQYGPLTTTTQYDEGNVGAIRQVVNAYGGEGELLSAKGSTEPVSYTYDPQYRVKTLKDAAGNTTSYFYNVAGYLAQVVYPGAGTPTAPLTAGTKDTVSFPGYDGAGNVLSRTDGNNVTTGYAYNDPESRLTDITYPSGSIGNVHYAYDSYGRRSQMTDGTGSQTYAYDDDNALTAKNITWPGLSAQTVSYGFYPDGSRQTMTAAGHSCSYSYDGDGRMTGLLGLDGQQHTWSYQANGWLLSKTLAGIVTTTFTRDAQGRITDLLNSQSGSMLSHFHIPATGGYDGVGNRLSVTSQAGGSAITRTYQYNYGQTQSPQASRSQLTQETYSPPQDYYNNASYAYDSGTSGGPGNPTTFGSTANTFNADNQVTNTGYAYDGNGNPNTYQSQSLAFDPENRMTSDSTGSQTDGYDGDGLRTWKQTSNGKLYFLYDGSQPVVEEYSNGNIGALNTFGADGLVSSRRPKLTLYTFDDRGNVCQRVQATTKTVSSTDDYTAYGSRIMVSQGSQPDPFGYGAQAGYYTDTETGLILCTHRFYDPNNGRWLTRDPMGYDGGINLYGYVGNNPGNRVDPSGHGGEVNQSGGSAGSPGGSGPGGPKFPTDGPIRPPVPRPMPQPAPSPPPDDIPTPIMELPPGEPPGEDEDEPGAVHENEPNPWVIGWVCAVVTGLAFEGIKKAIDSIPAPPTRPDPGLGPPGTHGPPPWGYGPGGPPAW